MRPADAGVAGQLLRESYAPTLRPFITHAQTGVDDYLTAVLQHPTLFTDAELSVAVDDDDRVVGFCEFTVRQGTSHLGYVCVSPEARGRGVATALIHEYLDRSRPHDVTLDVFTDNAAARALYDRLGFTEESQRSWYVRPLPAPTTPPVVLNGAEAVAAHTRYGFSNLTVSTATGLRTLGRTGDGVLRCRAVDDFADDELLASVRACFPGLTEALVIVPGSGEQPQVPDQTVVTRSARLVLRTGAAVPGRAQA